MSESLHVVNLIAKKGLNIDSRCQVCGLESKFINHVIFACSLARHVWALSNIPSRENGFESIALFLNFSFLSKSYKNNLIPLDTRRLIPWLV